MTRNDIAKVDQAITQLETFNLDEAIKKKFENSDIVATPIRNLSVSQFEALYFDTIAKFRTAITNDTLLLLPVVFVFPGMSNLNLSNELQELRNSLNRGDFLSAEDFLVRCAYYARIHRLLSSQDVLGEAQEFISSTRSQLQALARLLKKRQEEYDSAVSIAQQLNERLSDQLQSATKRVSDSGKALDEANESLKAIEDLRRQSIESNTRISAMAEAAQEKSKDMSEDAMKQRVTFEAQNEQFLLTQQSLQNQINSAKELYLSLNLKDEASNKLVKELESKSEQIDQLIGRATGASLFHTFNQRQIELQQRVDFWYQIVLWSSVLTLGLAGILFFWVGKGDAIENKLSSLLIGLPAYIWLYFCVRQYIKERRYQEEYAFKSAVALTISGYADLVKANDIKDELIKTSVSGVYEVPWKSDSVNDEPTTIIDAVMKGVNQTLRYARDIATKSK